MEMDTNHNLVQREAVLKEETVVKIATEIFATEPGGAHAIGDSSGERYPTFDEIILLQMAVEKVIGKKDSALRCEVAGRMREGWIDQEVALGYLLHTLYGRAFPNDNESARPAGKLAGTAAKRATGKEAAGAGLEGGGAAREDGCAEARRWRGGGEGGVFCWCGRCKACCTQAGGRLMVRRAGALART